jgi:copper resistance protein D
MDEAAVRWLHIVAVTVWIGPQFFLFLVAVPALRTIEDVQARTRLMRTIVTRFGWMAWAALGVIVATGIGNLFLVADQLGLSAGDLISGDLRYARLFWEKMFAVGVAAVFTALHSFVVGPRQLQLAEQVDADPAHIRNMRRVSMAVSLAVLVASLAAVYLAALMTNRTYSLVVE